MTVAHEKSMSGDFFCAPFGETADAPLHGWTANSHWQAEEIWQSGTEAVARLTLSRPVKGALVEKELRLRSGEPILYQTHRISGGNGGLSVAHHPMVGMSQGGRLSFSLKQVALTSGEPMDRGARKLNYPAQSSDLNAFPGKDGPVDLQDYRAGDGCQDFVTLIEAPGNDLGWTAVVRKQEDDVIFILKDPRVLPITMLWYAQGDAHPGEFLGIEDGCAAGAEGQVAAERDNAVSRFGVPTVLPLALNRVHLVRQAIGAMPRPSGWSEVADIRICEDQLRLMGSDGTAVHLPFDRAFFDLPQFTARLQ